MGLKHEPESLEETATDHAVDSEEPTSESQVPTLIDASDSSTNDDSSVEVQASTEHASALAAHDASTTDWAHAIAYEADSADCLTIGITNGSRLTCDRRTLDRINATLADELRLKGKRVLAIHLDAKRQAHAAAETSSTYPAVAENTVDTRRIPVAERSPLGNWSVVSIPVLGRSKATWELEQLPEWLPIWKDAFQLIIVDLGPMHLPESRAVGRLCDGCYVLLGPNACGSSEWIMQQAAWHHKLGSIITGSLVSNLAKAA